METTTTTGAIRPEDEAIRLQEEKEETQQQQQQQQEQEGSHKNQSQTAMEQEVNYEVNNEASADDDDDEHPGSALPEGKEAASQVTGAMEKDAAAGSKKRAASPSILVVEPGKPVEKRARTEPPHDNDEKEEEDAVNKEFSSNIKSTDIEGDASLQADTKKVPGADADEKEAVQQHPSPQMQMQQQQLNMMMHQQQFPMAPGMMMYTGGGNMMMSGSGSPRHAMMGMTPFYSGAAGAPGLGTHFGYPSSFGFGAANMAMMQQQQYFAMQQQQQHQAAAASKGETKANADDDNTAEKNAASDATNNIQQQNHPSQLQGHPSAAGGVYPPTPMFFPNSFFHHFGPVGPFGGNKPPMTASVNKGIRLSLACDHEHLSDYQRVIRRSLELFEAGPEDCESNTQGRKRAVVLGQVGLRCLHCSNLPIRSRGRGAVYYPARLMGIYQAAQNMAHSHLTKACQHIPVHVKEELINLRKRRDNASGGKQYWADGCRALGVYETETSGLMLRQQQQQQHEEQAAIGGRSADPSQVAARATDCTEQSPTVVNSEHV